MKPVHGLHGAGEHMVSLVDDACQIEKYAADHGRSVARANAPIKRAKVAGPISFGAMPLI